MRLKWIPVPATHWTICAGIGTISAAMTTNDYKQALERYRAIVDASGHDAVKGKANPYTSIKGNMFSFLDESGTLCLRLSKADREAFVRHYRTDPVVQYGAVMKEYVTVPECLAEDRDAVQACFEKCLSYAASLPAKPSR